MPATIDPVSALWLLLALVFSWMVYRFQKYNKYFDIADLFMNYTVRPPRADLTSVIIFMMALMAIYVCVVRASRNEDPTNLVVGVLGIFVLRQAFKIGADAYVAKAPPEHSDEPPMPPSNPLDKKAAK